MKTAVNGPEIIHKFYGESETHLRKIFEAAKRQAPSIVFLDEIDSIAPRREQVVGNEEKRAVRSNKPAIGRETFRGGTPRANPGIGPPEEYQIILVICNVYDKELS